MPEITEPLNINQAATEISVTTAVLYDLPDTPLTRWIEYRAYQELISLLRESGQLPDSYIVFNPEAHAVRDWLISGKRLQRRFSDEILDVITQVQAAGGGVFDNLCRFYCDWKQKGLLVLDGATLILHVAAIAAMVAAHASFLFIGGLPLTALIAYLIKTGILDKVCDCAAYLENA